MKGSYVLIIYLCASGDIAVGRLGVIGFQSGWYAYVGSAMRGLTPRLRRHLRENKKLHWHIDYFLQVASIKRVIVFKSRTRTECQIAGKLAERFTGIPGFGCSDCKCRSHLYYWANPDELEPGIARGSRIEAPKTKTGNRKK
jgi:Uri superfamily endonuclease